MIKKFMLKPSVCFKNILMNGHLFRKQLKQPPIIIGGCGRSGTTLLLSVLSSHPEIYTFKEETHAFCQNVYCESINFNLIIRTFRLYCYLDKKIPKSCNRWCEKTPKNVLFFGDILNYFYNNVKVIHIVRDGRDVILSKHPKRPAAYWVSPERWIEDVSAGLKFKNHPNVYTVKYEDLVLEYETTIKDICTFLGIEFHPHLLSWHEHAKMRRSSRVDNTYMQCLMNDSIGKWKETENNKRVEELLREPRAISLLKEFSYI